MVLPRHFLKAELLSLRQRVAGIGAVDGKSAGHAALLKANSPSCGSGTVYDGSFSGRLVSGDGVTAEYLKSKNLIIFKNPSTLLT